MTTTSPAYRLQVRWKRWISLWRNVGIMHAQPAAGMAALRHERWSGR